MGGDSSGKVCKALIGGEKSRIQNKAVREDKVNSRTEEHSIELGPVTLLIEKREVSSLLPLSTWGLRGGKPTETQPHRVCQR